MIVVFTAIVPGMFPVIAMMISVVITFVGRNYAARCEPDQRQYKTRGGNPCSIFHELSSIAEDHSVARDSNEFQSVKGRQVLSPMSYTDDAPI
jgi:hypothetical protein